MAYSFLHNTYPTIGGRASGPPRVNFSQPPDGLERTLTLKTGRRNLTPPWTHPRPSAPTAYPPTPAAATLNPDLT